MPVHNPLVLHKLWLPRWIHCFARGHESGKLVALRTAWRCIISTAGPERASAGDERALKSKADLDRLCVSYAPERRPDARYTARSQRKAKEVQRSP